MLSSNQILKISGTMDQLENVLDFVLKYSDELTYLTRKENPYELAYQITTNGLYCIAVVNPKRMPSGWNLYTCLSDAGVRYDSKIVARIIQKWIEQQPGPKSTYASCDGGHEIGFLCMASNDMRDSMTPEIENADYAMLAFKPFLNWYAK